MRSLGMLLGRWFIGAVFIFEAVQSAWHWEVTSAYLASKGFQMISLFQAIFIAIQFIGGVALLFGVKARLAALALVLFLVPITVIFHPFWNLPAGNVQASELTLFLKNCGILGGLMYILTIGAGNLSLDHRRWKKQVELEE